MLDIPKIIQGQLKGSRNNQGFALIQAVFLL